MKTVQIELSPGKAFDDEAIEEALRRELPEDFGPFKYKLERRSIDARGQIRYVLKTLVYESSTVIDDPLDDIDPYEDVGASKDVYIIGAGPAGLFAGLRCLQKGLRPIIIERGKNVRERRRDIALLTKEHIVNEDSNYCFGEGGAGAYSDGKLYTRSKKRGTVKEVLSMLVQHGAEQDILIDAHPHIGTNKLPNIIANIRQRILDHGGIIHFEERLKDILVEAGRIKSITTTKECYPAQNLVLATGHSARDMYMLLAKKEIRIEYKPFALGVRVEHPQALIDKVRYRTESRGSVLPPASYSLVCQVNGRGAYSFCMCPGGVIAPCATAPGEVVTNGWSPSKRNNPFANSGIVVEVRDEDVKEFGQNNPLRGMHFQSSIEKRACSMAGGTQAAPAQRLTDFVSKRTSNSLPASSYYPGLVSVDIHQVLPRTISKNLLGAFKQFDSKIPGYLTEEAVIVATESRTSSPVRIPRDKDSLEHPQVKGLYPSGEGAGYAGGIISAAIDGMRCIEQIALKVL